MRRLLILLPLILGSTAASVTAGDRPNIVFIESDSMDGRCLGFLGHPVASTPHLDALAADGTAFRNAYCNSPQCCPSRASMFSGLHTHEIEGWNNHKGIDDPEYRTFEVVLAENGYGLGAFGKRDHLSGAHSVRSRVSAWTARAGIALPQKARPVAKVNESGGRRQHGNWKMVDRSIRWLEEHADDDAPFFLYVGLTAPHPPFETSPYWLERIDPSAVDVPPVDVEPHPVMAHMSLAKNCLDLTHEEIRRIRRTYFAMIAEHDEMVGEIRRTVDELGLADDTWFIYLSDHGEMAMEHRQWLKNSVYEPSARVPIIVAGPGVREDVIVDDLVALIDVFPTLMDIAGIERPVDLAGESLMPLLRTGRDPDRRDWVLCQYHAGMTSSSIFMIRQGPWKYVAYPGFEPQLFNLNDDPAEITNRAADRPDVVQRLDMRLRSTLDVEEVTRRVAEYDKASFLAWRAQVGEDAYRETMASLYNTGTWAESHEAMIERWLRSKPAATATATPGD